MKISYKWLQEFVEIDKTPEEIAQIITMHAFEVEAIQKLGEGLNKVVVGEVVFKDKHPDADKLSITKVKISEAEILDIVCGAPNVDVGQKVAVALVGAILPNGMKIEERKVRGEKSCGMICAEDELALGKSHEGIMVLDANLPIGTPISQALHLDDTVLEVNVLPNRAHDCLCHYGLAREVAALTGKQIKQFGAAAPGERKDKNGVLEVAVLEKELCRRYSAAVVNDVTVKDSPDWLKTKLQSCELRPINNIVDITNYIMFSFGQPLHAFDADKLRGKIVVRCAKRGEKILALDDKDYELLETDLVIADEEKPIAIAGVIGGKEAAVSPATKNVIFESANFFGTGVRKTAQRLKVFTDASYRFEREIDPEITMPFLLQAVRLAVENGGGKVNEEIIDVYFEPREEKVIEFAYGRVENLLGINIPQEKTLEILNSLGLWAESVDDMIKVTVPTRRIDIEKVNDVIEEIARIYGYINIKAEPALVRMTQVGQDALWTLEREIRSAWMGLGFFEAFNYSLISEKDIVNLGLQKEGCLELRNYLSEDTKFFRTSLIPRLIKNVQENLKYRDEVRIFELGRVAFSKPGVLPEEKRYLSGAWTAADKPDEELFSAGKGLVEAFLEGLGFGEVRCQLTLEEPFFWHKGRSADMMVAGKLVGKMGEIHPQSLSKMGIDKRVFAFEIFEEELVLLRKEAGNYKDINKMPISEFDLAVVVDRETLWQTIEDSINSLNDASIRKVCPFDVYEGENIAPGKKSIAFRVVCQAQDKTLSDEEIKTIADRIIESLKTINAEIRK